MPSWKYGARSTAPGPQQQAPPRASSPEPQDAIAGRLEKVGVELTQRLDALNQAIAVAEQKLKEMKPPHNVWVSYIDREPEPSPLRPLSITESLAQATVAMSVIEKVMNGPKYALLGIAKVDNQWRLSHATIDPKNPSLAKDLKPLAECPVAIRVQAVSHLAKLREEILKEREAFVPQVEDAIKSVLDFCGGKA